MFDQRRDRNLITRKTDLHTLFPFIRKYDRSTLIELMWLFSVFKLFNFNNT